jgi:hypothetical protein
MVIDGLPRSAREAAAGFCDLGRVNLTFGMAATISTGCAIWTLLGLGSLQSVDYNFSGEFLR